MIQHHYRGLTAEEVAESRRQYGSNVLTPPPRATLWDAIAAACRHWIVRGLALFTVAGLVAAFLLQSVLGSSIWALPSVAAVSTLLIAFVGVARGLDSPLYKILIVAYVMSMGIAVYEYVWEGTSYVTFLEPLGIIVSLLTATGVAYALERSNEKTFQSLNAVNDDTPVKVVRDGIVSEIPRRDVVVGDTVLVDTGEEVPADGLLEEAYSLLVNESSLTGEPMSRKSADESALDMLATYPSNRLYKGTVVMEGNGIFKVTAVGEATESGRVFVAAQVDEGKPTPLSQKLDSLAMLITRLSYIVAAMVIVGRLTLWLLSGEDNADWVDFVSYLLHTAMLAVAIIVVAVPEGLPMSVTLSLALSMRQLMNEHTLPRTIHACETMGATSVICTDKTGTLTQNRMQVDVAHTADLLPELLAEMIALNTTANLDFSSPNPTTVGNPTEGALLHWLYEQQGVNYQELRERVEITDRLPFSTDNKYMATVVVSGVTGRKMLYVKGAPELLLAMSELPDDERKHYETLLTAFQHRAMRTLALAWREVDDNFRLSSPDSDSLENSFMPLRFAGIFSISDPVRPDAAQAISSCTNAGIRVVIVTGDTQATAEEIGRKVGLWSDADREGGSLTGSDFAAMSDEEASGRLSQLKILARAKPYDKERLVKLFRHQGLVVAATGDGTNDAPALNAADVGLSMGDGTAVAKESSDMTIQDNSFHTIVNAVMWGRSLYKNIQRFILFQATINVAACLIVLAGAFTGTESPLTVTQMLWVNLIMDTFAAIALASLPPSPTVMKEQPRRTSDAIISPSMARQILGVGGLFTLLLLFVLLTMQHADITSMASLFTAHYGAYDGLSDYEMSLFFTLFVMLQFWNMFNAKAFMSGESAFARLSRCRGFVFIAAIIFFGQIAIVEIGGLMFSVTHLHRSDWLAIILLTSLVLWVGEAFRKIEKLKS